KHYTLRLTDLRSIADAAAAPPQSPGARKPETLDPPHEMRQVDITDPKQVSSACAGMDVILNCTVIRPHPVEAFRVNLLGAYNVMLAAVEHRIRRVVHTGPQLVALNEAVGYGWDFQVESDVPLRPGSGIYGITKY